MLRAMLSKISIVFRSRGLLGRGGGGFPSLLGPSGSDRWPRDVSTADWMHWL
jgi:hypothetical protein